MFVEERRVALGLSKTAAVARAKISMSTWRKIEAGSNPMASPETLSRIARALEVDINDLLAAGHMPTLTNGHTRGPARVSTRQALAALLDGEPKLTDPGRHALLAVYDALIGSTAAVPGSRS